MGVWDVLGALSRGPDGFTFGDMADYAQRRLLFRALIGFVVAPIVLAPFAWKWMRDAERDANSPCRLVVDATWLQQQGLADAPVHSSASDAGCHARWELDDCRLEVDWTPLFGDFEEQIARVASLNGKKGERVDIADAPAALWVDDDSALVNVRGKVLQVDTHGPIDVEEATEVVVAGVRKTTF